MGHEGTFRVATTRTVGGSLRTTIQARDGRTFDVDTHSLSPAVAPGSDVDHHPPQITTERLGIGRVEQLRVVGGRHQVLVDFWERGNRRWLPWEHLVPIPMPRTAMLKGVKPQAGSAEAFRLRSLVHALDSWHTTTGALTKLEIDPLPHQIHVAHKILTSGTLDWMIADDVGLGKTVEVGLILTALTSEARKRILLAVPAGLTLQWQEELRTKFGLTEFVVYGEDFTPSHPDHWRLAQHVIVSIDRLKREGHLGKFLECEPWDLVVFDEAHQLSRTEYRDSRSATERYAAAEKLRKHTAGMMLLTGTPHQGREDRFRALLELLRPGNEWRERFVRLARHPEILADLIVRNRKADVTDAQGRFVFRGKDVRTVDVPTTEEATAFDRSLRRYVQLGYAASAGSHQRLAIGFVMTVYRKLASSSHAAIVEALRRRLARITAQGTLQRRRTNSKVLDDPSPIDDDGAFVDREEDLVDRDATADPFFEGERQELERLLHLGDRLLRDDAKLRWFMQAVREASDGDPNTKILVFTEYRTTLAHLTAALAKEYGEDNVVTIHGGQPFEHRRASIATFHDEARFLVSTEAGGEGLNLQKNCHVLVNYDLPWNPMRLVQRVGRLYRYGQSKRVQVVNLKSNDSLDRRLLSKMYERIEVVASELAHVGDFADGSEGLIEDVLGDLVANLDVTEMLEAADTDEERSEERLEEALKRAHEAAKHQQDLLMHASRFDGDTFSHRLALGTEHLMAFVEGACARFDIAVRKLHRDTVWELHFQNVDRSLELPDATRRTRISFERSVAATREAELFGPSHWLYVALRRRISQASFGGRFAVVQALEGRLVASKLLRWTDDLGRPVYDEYIAAVERTDGTIDVNPSSFAVALLRPWTDATRSNPGTQEQWQNLETTIDATLALRATSSVHPDAPFVVGIGVGD